MLCVLLSPGTVATAIMAPVTAKPDAATNVDSVSGGVVPRKKVVVVKRKAPNDDKSDGVGDEASTEKSAGVVRLNNAKLDHSPFSSTSGSVVCDLAKTNIGGGKDGRKRPVGDDDGRIDGGRRGGDGGRSGYDGGRSGGDDGRSGGDGGRSGGDGGRSGGDGGRVVLKKPRNVMSHGVDNQEVEEGVKVGNVVNAKKLSNGGVVGSSQQRVCGDGDEVQRQPPVENIDGQTISRGNVKKTVRVRRKVLKGGVQVASPMNEAMTSPEPVRVEESKLATKGKEREHVTSPGSAEVILTERKKSLAEIKAEM